MQNPTYRAEIQAPIWRDTQALMLAIEQAVRDFPRYHKYTLGSDLRRLAMRISHTLHSALADTSSERLAQVSTLVVLLDDLKALLVIGKDLLAFKSFYAFEQLIRQARVVSQRAIGWRKNLYRRQR